MPSAPPSLTEMATIAVDPFFLNLRLFARHRTRMAPKPETYRVVELAGDRRLILALGDGRMFGVDLDEPLKGELPERVKVSMTALAEDGVPENPKIV